jgi:hypothetical protein
MPTEEENVQYLYLVLTHGGTPTVSLTILVCSPSQQICTTLCHLMN